MMMSNRMNPLSKRVLEINKTGVLTNEQLLIPGVSSGFVEGFKLHIHEIEITVSAASRVTLKIGNHSFFDRRCTTANAEYHTEDDNNHNGSEADQTLKLSIDTAGVTVIGYLRYSFQ